MTMVFFRRRRLGLGSLTGIVGSMQTRASIQTHNRLPRTARREGQWPEDSTKVVRWGCTAETPTDNRHTTINTSHAIHAVNDKPGFREMLMQHHQLNGGQLLCPRTWSFDDYLDHAAPHLPVVIRPSRHAQGRNLYVCRTATEVARAIERCRNGYVSELINKVAEYRVFVAQGRAVWVANKTPGNPDQMAWNVARGGRFDNVGWGDWPLRVVRVAIEAFNLTDLHFGGVDVIVDDDGRAYVIEINSAPSQTSPYRQECCARVFDFMNTEHVNRIPMTDERGGWRKFIHPAISNEATML